MLENEIKINQLPMIGKIFKYEFISLARTLLPVFGALILISAVAGFFLFTEDFFEGFDDNKMGMFFLLIPIVIIFICAVTIITYLQLGRRFKKSMLGNEAYLNLTLPVSLWSHLFARIISAFVWLLIHMVVIIASIVLLYKNLWIYLYKEISEEYTYADLVDLFFDYTGRSLNGTIALYCVALIISLVYIAAFIYMVYSIGHLAKKHRVLVQFIVVVVALSAVNMVEGQFATGLLLKGINEGMAEREIVDMLYNAFFVSTGCEGFFTLVFAAISYLILRFKLNLE